MLKCFQFAENKSDTIQVIFLPGMDVIKVNPGEIVDISDVDSVPSFFERIPNVISYILDRNIEQVTLKRESAVGDILMMVPVAKYLKKKYGLNVFIQTFNNLDEVIPHLGVGMVNRPTGLTVCLDRVVEKDHTVKECQKYHRIELYLRALGMEDEFKSSDLNWDCDFVDFGYPVIDGDYMVFHGIGSRLNKSLKYVAINEALRILSKKYKVVYIGPEKEIEKVDNVFYACEKYSLVQLFNIITLAKCLICMDSAPLWISHFTKTPVVAVLGPTPAKNRISFHPLYEEGARAIQLNDDINCQSCFEHAVACNFKFKCLDISGKELCDKINGYVEGFMGN